MPFDTSKIVAQVADCGTNKEISDAIKQAFADDPVIADANQRRKALNQIKRDAERQLTNLRNEPWHDEAKRWKRGDKVYFARGIDSFMFGWDFKPVRGSEKKIKSGDWCYVWSYHPRSKYAWLCKPKSKCTYANIINSTFGIREIRELGISRVEPKMRGDDWRK